MLLMQITPSAAFALSHQEQHPLHCQQHSSRASVSSANWTMTIHEGLFATKDSPLPLLLPLTDTPTGDSSFNCSGVKWEQSLTNTLPPNWLVWAEERIAVGKKNTKVEEEKQMLHRNLNSPPITKRITHHQTIITSTGTAARVHITPPHDEAH